MHRRDKRDRFRIRDRFGSLVHRIHPARRHSRIGQFLGKTTGKQGTKQGTSDAWVKAHQRLMDATRASRARVLGIVVAMRVWSTWRLVLATLALGIASCTTDRPGSIGAHLSRDNETGAVYVKDLFPGLAGERAGLLAGDELVMIDGFYVRELGAPRVREMLRGPVGTAVRLTVVRGGLVLRLKVTRSELREAVEEQPKPRMETLKE